MTLKPALSLYYKTTLKTINIMTTEQKGFIKENKLKVKVNGVELKKHFTSDKQARYVFNVTLSANGKQYTFDFGQSVSRGNEEPTLLDVICCFQKYDLGTFEDFCDGFGYNNDSIAHSKIYLSVLKEYSAMVRLFGSEKLEYMADLFQ